MPPEHAPVQVEGEGREGVDEAGGQLVQTVEHYHKYKSSKFTLYQI